MPIYTIAQYQVKPSGTEKVKGAIEEFVRYVKANEPGTRHCMQRGSRKMTRPVLCTSSFSRMQQRTTSIASQRAVKQFEAIYRPELVGGDVVFTDYDLVATNQELTSPQRKAG